MPETLIYRTTTGLNNRVDPTRLKFDPQQGIAELAVATNVDIDQTGGISRRKGYQKLTSLTNPHSLWSSGDACFVVSEGVIYKVNSNYSLKAIVTGLNSDPVCFASLAGKVFWNTGTAGQNGIIDANGDNLAWAATQYVGPDTIYQVSLAPPPGSIMETMSGYLLIAQGPTLWFSMQFAPLYWRLSRDRVHFQSDITVVQAVEDGLWVSDSKSAYFLQGHDPQQWLALPKSGFSAYPNPAIAGTAVGAQGGMIGQGQFMGRVAVWTSPRGICVGGSQGQFVNLTERKLVYPRANQGSAVLIDNQRYVVSLQS